jgi:GntR family transcriptional regulator
MTVIRSPVKIGAAGSARSSILSGVAAGRPLPGAGAAGRRGSGPAPTGGRALNSNVALHARLATSLRERLRDGEWAPGDQLPTEAELSADYGVSRSTVRAALVQLEKQGLTVTRHGLGTFVTPFGRAIKAGLQELQSMTDTIVAHGMEPRIDYRNAEIREATEEERAALERDAPCRVLATTRAVHADDVLVAFSYEGIPTELLPADLDPAAVRGSLFALLESSGAVPRTAVAGVHATRGRDIGWGERPRGATYLLLQQVHYDAHAVPLLCSKTYFVEGRFQFSILRVR